MKIFKKGLVAGLSIMLSVACFASCGGTQNLSLDDKVSYTAPTDIQLTAATNEQKDELETMFNNTLSNNKYGLHFGFSIEIDGNDSDVKADLNALIKGEEFAVRISAGTDEQTSSGTEQQTASCDLFVKDNVGYAHMKNGTSDIKKKCEISADAVSEIEIFDIKKQIEEALGDGVITFDKVKELLAGDDSSFEFSTVEISTTGNGTTYMVTTTNNETIFINFINGRLNGLTMSKTFNKETNKLFKSADITISATIEIFEGNIEYPDFSDYSNENVNELGDIMDVFGMGEAES